MQFVRGTELSESRRSRISATAAMLGRIAAPTKPTVRETTY
jgi:hypothetical protein